MKITVLNGNPHETDFNAWLSEMARHLGDSGHTVRNLDLRTMNIGGCTGCWTCWWKTPGECMYRDDLTDSYADILDSDLIVFASPLVLGNVSALLRGTQDRLIPLLHPYITLVEGEMHHRKRYDRMPLISLVYEATDEDTDEDLAIVKTLFERFALNFRSRLAFMTSVEKQAQEAAHEALAC